MAKKLLKFELSNLPVSIFKEGKAFVAYSPVLDLSTSGKTYEEVRSRFEEAVQIFFQETARKGTTDEVLLDLGWKKIKNDWAPPVVVAQNFENISVPVAA